MKKPFRAMTAELKVVYGYLIDEIDGGNPIIVTETNIEDNGSLNLGYVPVLPETIGRNTGILDRRGVSIYEHDVIQFGNKKGLVNWSTGCFSVRLIDPDHHYSNPAIDIVLNEYPGGLEVIGNVLGPKNN